MKRLKLHQNCFHFSIAIQKYKFLFSSISPKKRVGSWTIQVSRFPLNLAIRLLHLISHRNKKWKRTMSYFLHRWFPFIVLSEIVLQPKISYYEDDYLNFRSQHQVIYIEVYPLSNSADNLSHSAPLKYISKLYPLIPFLPCHFYNLQTDVWKLPLETSNIFSRK